MANIKISQLTAASATSDTQEFEVNDSGTSKKVTGSQIKDYVKDGLAISDVAGLQDDLDTKANLSGATFTGSVGIGAAPSYDLDISKSDTTAVAVRVRNTNTAGTDPDANVFIDAGNINGEANVEFQKGGTSYGRLAALQEDMRLVADLGDIEFSTGGSVSAVITSVGDLELNGGGTTAGGFSFGAVGDVVQYRSNSTATTGAFNIYSNWGATNRNVFRVRTDGNVLNYNNSYGALSDAKLKENVADATPKLEDLCKLRVVNFNYIGDENKQLGLIAQEVEQVFPKLVDENNDTDADGNETGEVTKSVKYSILVPMLVKALQEQQDMISALEARISAIEAK